MPAPEHPAKGRFAISPIFAGLSRQSCGFAASALFPAHELDNGKPIYNNTRPTRGVGVLCFICYRERGVLLTLNAFRG